MVSQITRMVHEFYGVGESPFAQHVQDRSACVLPFSEAYLPSNTGPQIQLTTDTQGPILPADLEVQYALTGYGGEMKRVLGTSDVHVPDAFPAGAALDDPLGDVPLPAHSARDPFNGPPSASRYAAMSDALADASATPRQPRYAVPPVHHPRMTDFVSSAPLAYWVGTDADAADALKGGRCSCLPPKDLIYSSVQALQLSAKNYAGLQRTLIDAGLILGVHRVLVWQPRTAPCLCSYIGRTLASEFVDFSARQRLTHAAKEFDIDATLTSENQQFARNVLGRLFSVQQQKQRAAYDRAAGRLRGLSLRGAFEPDAPALPRRVACLGASDAPQVFGPDFTDNPATYQGARALSRPSTIFHEDLLKLTGIDYTKHKEWSDREIPMR